MTINQETIKYFDYQRRNSPSSGNQPTPFGHAGGQGSNQLAGGKGSTVVQRHKIEGIRRLAAHSHLPLYVAGSQDESIRM